jgi:D-alanyl-lipoteichoic acid acyltransferase DltB (MBOAT superfamily)
MIFQSLDFLVFLVLVVALHWALPSRMRNPFLLAASYFFYGYVHPWFLLLLWFVTLAVYGCALGMDRLPGHRRLFLSLGIGACLGMLAVFKYLHFFVDNVVFALQSLGLRATAPEIQIALPVGISFFAFQGMSYVIDVYRGQVAARADLLNIALFKAFFPQLVAGPIERATHLLPQLERHRVWRTELFVEGFLLIVWGFFKKLVIADNVSIIANKIFMLQHPSFPVLWAGVLAFCVQIFADFSAYTDIARGCAKMLGINLVENFRHPYAASSPSDFWRRWHISLSSWLRDYVYIPLGGNRGGQWRAARNVLVTFLLSGLWHGASWNYVIWGGYWGLLIIGSRFFGRLLPERLWERRGVAALQVAVMFAFTNLGWLLFRETDLHFLLQDLALSPRAAPAADWEAARYFVSLVCIYALPLLLHYLVDRRNDFAGRVAAPAAGRSLALRTAATAAMFCAILVLRTANSGDFIYFKF